METHKNVLFSGVVGIFMGLDWLCCSRRMVAGN